MGGTVLVHCNGEQRYLFSHQQLLKIWWSKGGLPSRLPLLSDISCGNSTGRPSMLLLMFRINGIVWAQWAWANELSPMNESLTSWTCSSRTSSKNTNLSTWHKKWWKPQRKEKPQQINDKWKKCRSPYLLNVAMVTGYWLNSSQRRGRGWLSEKTALYAGRTFRYDYGLKDKESGSSV